MSLQDLHDLHDALTRLDMQRYLDEIDLVDPVEFYMNVAKNAPMSLQLALKDLQKVYYKR